MPSAASLLLREEVRRGGACQLSQGEPVSKVSLDGSYRDWSQWADLAAFLAVLAAGVVLIVVGHMTVGGLTTVCAALVGLFGAYRHLRR